MDWSGVLSSAAVSCVFSAIPIPTGKTAIAAMVGGAGLSAAEAFSANVLSQYSSLRNSYSNPKTILEKIKWEESFKEAGSSGVITFISTVLIRGGSHGTVLALKNRIVNIAEKKGSDYVRAKLISLGFTDDFIDKIFVKWGVKGDLARGLLPNSKVLLKKSFNSTDFASAPKLPITIVQKAGKTFAQSAEELIADLFEKKGMKKLESKIGGDNGFDILLVDNISNPKQVIVIEVKSSISSTHSASMNNPVNACAGTNEPQMSWCWLNDVYERMTKSPNSNIKHNAAKIESFIKSGKVERYIVSAISPNGEAKIIGL